MRDSVRQLVSGVVTALLLAVTSVACGGDFVTYYHYDVVGSPVAATDEQGRLMWRSQYRPYGGRIQSATDVAASANTSRWYGAYVDEGDGALTYMGGRYYDPSIGRFMGTDAQGFHIANVQSFGRYTYANNNPFSFKDPDGELPILVGVVVYGAGKAALENIAIQTAELGLGLRDEFSLSELAVDAAVGGISGGQASTVKNGARAVRIAEGVAKQAKQTERIAQNAKPLYRNMSKAEAEAVQQTGKLRGGKEGPTYFTDSRFRSADTAQDRLSLPNRPEVQMEFRIKNNPSMTRKGTRVTPDYDGDGGGREYMTYDPVEVEIINVQPYR